MSSEIVREIRKKEREIRRQLRAEARLERRRERERQREERRKKQEEKTLLIRETEPLVAVLSSFGCEDILEFVKRSGYLGKVKGPQLERHKQPLTSVDMFLTRKVTGKAVDGKGLSREVFFGFEGREVPFFGFEARKNPDGNVQISANLRIPDSFFGSSYSPFFPFSEITPESERQVRLNFKKAVTEQLESLARKAYDP